jgi:cobalamin transport system ATP-binding protein
LNDPARPDGTARALDEDVPILSARGLVFRHPGAQHPLFGGLSLAVEPGAFLGIIGPNGSGKTTLLRLLSGSLAPRSGEVHLAGRPVRGLPPRERARLLAVVPQEEPILFNFSVLEVVLMGRAPYLGFFGLERAADFALARAVLRDLDLGGREETHLRELSSGERQRTLIARALAQDPRVLLLDEPTAFLDMRHRLEIYDILRRLNHDTKLTVVFVSHDLNLAARHATRLAVIDRGRLAADGAPASVLTPDLIRAVYGTEARVERDHATGAPYVIPERPLPADRSTDSGALT